MSMRRERGILDNAAIPRVVGHPDSIFLLTGDAGGVLPPASRWRAEEALDHRTSAYNTKLAGSEIVVTHPEGSA